MGKKRIEFIDLAKGICILMVLAEHICPEIGMKYEFLTGLRMPLYFCLSGMFFKSYAGIMNFLVKKIDRLLIPFMAWYVISFTLYFLRVTFLGEASEEFHFTDVFTQPYFYNLPLWFLMCLFWSNLIYYFVNKISQKYVYQLPITVLLSLVGWAMSYSDLPNYYFIGTSLTCLPFFFLGTLMFRTGFLSDTQHKKRDVLFILSGVAVVSGFLLISADPLMMTYYNNTLVSGSHIALYVCGAALVISLLLICKFIGSLPFISYLGRYSIICLVTHELIRNVLNRGVRLFLGMDWEETYYHLALFVIIALMMPGVIYLCRRYLPYISAQKELLGEIRQKFRKKEPELAEE